MSDNETPKRVISEDVRKATKSCCHGFRCLTDDEHPLCAVEYMSGDVLFVKAGAALCPYLVSFGLGFLCRCPARLDIHRSNLAEDT
jgi:hypothetical protein